jgi:hypothetical protein
MVKKLGVNELINQLRRESEGGDPWPINSSKIDDN